MANIVVAMTESEAAVIKELIGWWRNNGQNTRQRPAVPYYDVANSDIYVAKVPVGGIAAHTEHTGTGGEVGTGTVTNVSSAECALYQVRQGGDLIVLNGFTQTIFNLSDTVIAGGTWILAVKDTGGTFFAVDLADIPSSGSALGIVTHIYSVNDTWLKSPNLVFVEVEVVGGGGGGGGGEQYTSALDSDPKRAAAGGGGGGGGYAYAKINAVDLLSSESVTVGAGGTKGTNAGGGGSSGGASSFGSHAHASGGSGGTGMGLTNTLLVAEAGSPGVGDVGDYITGGERGEPGNVSLETVGNTTVAYSGNGGSTLKTGGGKGKVISTGLTFPGSAPSSFTGGGGGGGGVGGKKGVSESYGGEGGAGLVIVREYRSTLSSLLSSSDVTAALGYTPGTGNGTVTSVSGSGGTTGLTLTGGAITISGTLTIGGTLIVANGGTGLTACATGDLFYGSATNVLSALGIGSTGDVLTVAGGVPTWAAGGGMAIGGAVTSGTAHYGLFVDGAGKLGQNSGFQIGITNYQLLSSAQNAGDWAALFSAYSGFMTLTLCKDGTSVAAASDGTNTVSICDGTYPINVTAGSINVLGTTGNIYRWNAGVSAPTPQTLLSLPLSTFGSGTINQLLGTPDYWVLVNVGGIDIKLPGYL